MDPAPVYRAVEGHLPPPSRSDLPQYVVNIVTLDAEDIAELPRIDHRLEALKSRRLAEDEIRCDELSRILLRPKHSFGFLAVKRNRFLNHDMLTVLESRDRLLCVGVVVAAHGYHIDMGVLGNFSRVGIAFCNLVSITDTGEKFSVEIADSDDLDVLAPAISGNVTFPNAEADYTGSNAPCHRSYEYRSVEVNAMSKSRIFIAFDSVVG